MLKGVGETIGIVQYNYTYKYHGKHVYRYSTSVEHSVTLKNLHAYCYCMLCFSASLADVECLLVVRNHTHT